MVLGRWVGRLRSHRAVRGAAGVVVTVSMLQLAVSGTAQVVATGGGPARVGDRPNIVFIMVDDMRDDDLRYMPATRALVRQQGVRFVNSFSPFPLCCPARATVLSGRYPHNTDVYGVLPPYGFSSFDDRSTIATWLQGAGYWTTYLGKYLNGYGGQPPHGVTQGNSLRYVPPGWTKWRASIDGGLPAGDPRAGSTYFYKDTTLSVDGQGFTNYAGRFQTGVYGDLAEDILRRRTAPGEPPFFFYLSFTAPHSGMPLERDDPTTVPRDGSGSAFYTPARPRWTWGMFDAVIKQAPGVDWSDPDITDKPWYIAKDPPLGPAERAAVLELTRQRAEALAAVDVQVRRVVDVLRQSGELGSTYIVFTSDNGFFLGEQRRRQGKIFPYEPSIRVPLLIRGPGIPANSTRYDPFMSTDFAPTLAAMAGTSPPHELDGISLLEVARHGDVGWKRAVLTETGPAFNVRRGTDEAGAPLEPGKQRDVRYIIGIRTARYLYTDLATGERELYDLSTDPREYRNVVRDPAYSDVVDVLSEVLARTRACRGAGCRTPLPPVPGPHPG